MIQVTNSVAAPDNPSVSDTLADGTQWVAFDAFGGANGGSGPSSLRRQIYMKNLRTDELLQITNATDGDSTRPAINNFGGILAFESTAALAGVASPGGVAQIFLYDRRDRILKQITNGAGPSTRPIANEGGRVFAFQSTADLLGDGHDTGISQIFWIDHDRETNNTTLHQLTNGNGPSERPYVSESNSIVFESTATDLAGAPGGPGHEIYASSIVTKEGEPVTLRRLTSTTQFGDCSYPADLGGGDRVAFVCTGDPLSNGTTGNRVFILDELNGRIYQLTGKGDVQGPIGSSLGQWFVTLSTSSDLDREGACGYGIFAIDYFNEEPGHWTPATQPGQLPQDANPPTVPPITNAIGKHAFELAPANTTAGSRTSLTARSNISTAGIYDPGRFMMVIGAPDQLSQIASIKVPRATVAIPPVSVLGVGTLCLTAREDGQGVIDCDGGANDRTLLITQDHVTQDEDQNCALGCREGEPCKLGLLGLHGKDSKNICNGPLRTNLTGTSPAGQMQLTLPITVGISVDSGIDRTYCTSDDSYALPDIPTTLRLTTGTADTTIADADAVARANLSSTDAGAPFSCTKLKAGDLTGARLVAGLPLLDVPLTPLRSVIRDVILGLSLEPKAAEPVCLGACDTSDDCNDNDGCTGVERCLSGYCIPGHHFAPCTPCTTVADCNDSTICTTDVCNETLGICEPEAVPDCVPCVIAENCEDGDPCTSDVCSTEGACVNTVLENCTGCAPSEDCGDGVDNDCDGFSDCSDPGCEGVAECEPLETCGNCRDDDGDGFVDFEDADCCAEGQTFAMTLSRGRITPKGPTSRVRLRSVLATKGLENVNPTSEDVFVQLQATDGEMICAQVPARKFKRTRRAFKFVDKARTVSSAQGFTKMTIKIRRDGSVAFKTRGKRIGMTTPHAGPVKLTVGFRKANGGDEANRCSTTTQSFRANRAGALRTP